MKRLIAILLSILLVGCMTGCNKKAGETKVEKIVQRTAPLKFGLNAHIYEQRAMDPGSTMDYVAEMTAVLGMEYYRLSTPLDSMFSVGEGDTLTFKEGFRDIVHQVIQKMSAAGVKKFVAVSDSPIRPYGYEATCSGVIPDPDIEKEMYIRWVKLYAKAWGMIVKEFPEITHVEPMNEPDISSDNIFAKQGHEWARDDGFVYDITERAHILADIQYYIYKEVKAVNPNVAVTTPGFSTSGQGLNILDDLYNAIESGAHPYPEVVSDKDPDHYFDVINYHAYFTHSSNNAEIYFNHVDTFYKASERHNDPGKPALLTEWGFTDNGNEATQTENGQYMAEQLKIFEEKMPYLEAALVYMLNDYYGYSVSDAENNFGLFSSRNNPEKPSCPKPAAIELYKFMHKTEDVSPLYKHCPELMPK